MGCPLPRPSGAGEMDRKGKNKQHELAGVESGQVGSPCLPQRDLAWACVSQNQQRHRKGTHKLSRGHKGGPPSSRSESDLPVGRETPTRDKGPTPSRYTEHDSRLVKPKRHRPNRAVPQCFRK